MYSNLALTQSQLWFEPRGQIVCVRSGQLVVVTIVTGQLLPRRDRHQRTNALYWSEPGVNEAVVLAIGGRRVIGFVPEACAVTICGRPDLRYVDNHFFVEGYGVIVQCPVPTVDLFMREPYAIVERGDSVAIEVALGKETLSRTGNGRGCDVRAVLFVVVWDQGIARDAVAGRLVVRQGGGAVRPELEARRLVAAQVRRENSRLCALHHPVLKRPY